MKRHEFEHAVRAAGAVLGVEELIVIGERPGHSGPFERRGADSRDWH